ncbi:MAG: LysR family transcriptional regulator [Oxalicibacterium faecigallinarum]|uniref:LysR family transcriptional regulator n=1 Tax=Oxalicibacterium faecigallinarum TaxID=573741 RepID=UPI002807F0EE|nr:LysR family transcriptional regulator [Oxalicibacterium faecigallinarum]MDQ7968372.1 LysR family transcriptional regulator [Oxalicibacterium faecigallinarum]
MDSLKGVESFVKAVEEGGIAAAGRRLGVSAAAVSQNIARLEQQLGTRLLVRTTRRLALTESGQLYFQRVQALVRELEHAQAELSDWQDAPQGKLRIACSAAFGRNVLAPLIPAFARRYPRLMMELVLADHYVDHIREEIDVSIRFAQQLEPGLVARRIACVPLRFCAAPSYLTRHGVPQQPEDLQAHQCLLFRSPMDGRLLGWGFLRHGVRFEPRLNPAMISNDIDSLARFAVDGAGIARLGAFIADPLIAQGLLVPLFEVEQGGRKKGKADGARADIEPLTFYACYQDRRAANGKLRLFLDYLLESMPPAWQLQMKDGTSPP